MAPSGTQDVNAAAITAPNIETALITKEEQAQWDTDALVKALEEANCRHDELVVKHRDTQAAWEKCKVEQREVDTKVRGRLLADAKVRGRLLADAKVRGRLLANAAMAEVR